MDINERSHPNHENTDMMAPRLRAPLGARRGKSRSGKPVSEAARGGAPSGTAASITKGGMGVSTPIIVSERIGFSYEIIRSD